MIRYHTQVESPIGVLTLASDGAAITGVYMDEVPRDDKNSHEWVVRDDLDILQRAKSQLASYFAGLTYSFDLPIAPTGTPFQRRVWDALLAIPYGETRSYGAIAHAIGIPNASRAVGLANGRNPIAIVIPCHRVIGANGTLTGYGGGLWRKKILLDLEQSHLLDYSDQEASIVEQRATGKLFNAVDGRLNDLVR